jgi:3-isopropylmalate/(R)-2-methylmalate dehydratase small subunit
MDKFTVHSGRAVPLRRSNVDTDQIIPALYLKRVSRSGFADGLFAEWRKDPDFVLNRGSHEAATILVAGPDFGIGSSREHAVWALQDYGFRAVIAPSFGDIFRGNALKAGLLPVALDRSVIEHLWHRIEADPATELTVDLVERQVRCTVGSDALAAHFDLDDFARWRLLEGLDDVDLTLQKADTIANFEGRRPGWLPTTM